MSKGKFGGIAYLDSHPDGGVGYQRDVGKRNAPLVGFKRWREYHADCSVKDAIAWRDKLKHEQNELVKSLWALPDQDRAQIVALGGWFKAKHRLCQLGADVQRGERIAAIAASIDYRHPLPNPSLRVPGPEARATTPQKITQHPAPGGWDAYPLKSFPIKQTRSVYIRQISGGGMLPSSEPDKLEFIALPSEPENWAATKLDLQEWGSRLEAKARRVSDHLQPIVLKVEPDTLTGFDALLQIWIGRRPANEDGTSWQGRTDGHEATIRKLKEYFPTKRFADLTHADIRAWLVYMESNEPKKSQMKHFERAQAMYRDAVADGKIAFNPCKGNSVRNKPKRSNNHGEGKPTFTAEQLTLFLDKVESNPKQFGGKRHDAAKWLIWLMAYMGMRPGEVTQLQRGDVYVRHGVKVVHVRAIDCVTGLSHAQKRVKTVKSSRILPLHPECASFFQWSRGRNDPQAFLFDCFRFDKGKKTRAGWLSLHGGKFIRQTCGIKCTIPGKRLVPYSLRHTYISIMRDSKIERARQLVLTGHATGEIHDEYGRPAKLRLLAADVATIDPCKDATGAEVLVEEND